MAYFRRWHSPHETGAVPPVRAFSLAAGCVRGCFASGMLDGEAGEAGGGELRRWASKMGVVL